MKHTRRAQGSQRENRVTAPNHTERVSDSNAECQGMCLAAVTRSRTRMAVPSTTAQRWVTPAPSQSGVLFGTMSEFTKFHWGP